MGTKRAADSSAKVQATAESVQYSKEQLLCAEKYNNQRDLVNALLNEKESYTIETVDKKIEEFMKGKVK